MLHSFSDSGLHKNITQCEGIWPCDYSIDCVHMVHGHVEMLVVWNCSLQPGSGLLLRFMEMGLDMSSVEKGGSAVCMVQGQLLPNRADCMQND